MKARAAVAWAPKQPLSIEELDVEGPKEGEVLLKVVASGVCHTDAFTLSGQDPEGAFPCVLGHEGGCEVLECGPGVKTLKPGDHVIPAVHSRVRRLRVLQRHQEQPVPVHRRHRVDRLYARRHAALFPQRQTDLSLHGLLDLLRVHRGAGNRAGQDQPGRAAGQGVPAGLRRHHRHRRGAEHRQGGSRRHRLRYSGWAASACRSSRAR